MIALGITTCVLALGPPEGKGAAPGWHWFQIGSIFTLAACWLHVTETLAKPSAGCERERQERVQRACARGGVVGLSQEWVCKNEDALSTLTGVAAKAALGTWAIALVCAYPSSVVSTLGQTFQAAWTDMRGKYSGETLWLAVTTGIHVVVFWPIGVASAILELWRPAVLEPYKIQQDKRLTVRELLKASSLAVVNQGLLLATCVGIWHTCGPIMDAALAPELPDAPTPVASSRTATPSTNRPAAPHRCQQWRTNLPLVAPDVSQQAQLDISVLLVVVVVYVIAARKQHWQQL